MFGIFLETSRIDRYTMLWNIYILTKDVGFAENTNRILTNSVFMFILYTLLFRTKLKKTSLQLKSL